MANTAKITMVSTTRYDGQAYLAGHEYEVHKDDAERWVRLGIAQEGGGKRKASELTTHEQAQRDVATADLEVASLHGDVAAARQLDAQRAGDTGAAAETTGESARHSLGR